MFFSEKRQWICLCLLCLPFSSSWERSHQFHLPSQRQLFQIPTFTAFLMAIILPFSKILWEGDLPPTSQGNRGLQEEIPSASLHSAKAPERSSGEENGWNGVEKGGHTLGPWSSTVKTIAATEHDGNAQEVLSKEALYSISCFIISHWLLCWDWSGRRSEAETVDPLGG